MRFLVSNKVSVLGWFLSGAGMLLALAGCSTVPTSANSTGKISAQTAVAPVQMVEVSAREVAGVSHFYAHNPMLAPVTVTFNAHLSNLLANTPFPQTTTVPAGHTVEVFALTPIQAGKPWDYQFTDSSVIGSREAVHDDSHVYLLPYAPGSSFKVTQGYHGRVSHTGPDEYAIDWKMPVGTPVHAARGGLVVKSKDDSDVGGSSRKFEAYANCILILHDDGTVGVYGHLKKGGNRVKVGDRVKEGDFIALSGNTGFSNGPHLHFSVFKAKDGWNRESVPVQFRSANCGVTTLVSGQSYQAASAEMQVAQGSSMPTGEVASSDSRKQLFP